MIDNDFDKKIVTKIKEEKISPKPAWYFSFKDDVFWVLGIVLLSMGAGVISIMIYLFKYNSWDLQVETHKSFWEFFIATLPYFWIILLILFIIVLYYNFKQVKDFYRYSIWRIVFFILTISLIFGALFYSLGWGEKMDNVLGSNAPLYDTVINRHLSFWFKPDEGRLIGIVSSKSEDNTFEIIDPQGTVWQILSSNHVDPSVIRLNRPVDLIGEVLLGQHFHAKIVRSIKAGRCFFPGPERSANKYMFH